MDRPRPKLNSLRARWLSESARIPGIRLRWNSVGLLTEFGPSKGRALAIKRGRPCIGNRCRLKAPRIKCQLETPPRKGRERNEKGRSERKREIVRQRIRVQSEVASASNLKKHFAKRHQFYVRSGTHDCAVAARCVLNGQRWTKAAGIHLSTRSLPTYRVTGSTIKRVLSNRTSDALCIPSKWHRLTRGRRE